MALITCPECGKEISDKATTCPNCGMPLVAETSEEAPTTVSKENIPVTPPSGNSKKNKPQNKNTKLSIASLIFTVLGALSFTESLVWIGIILGCIDFFIHRKNRKFLILVISFAFGVIGIILCSVNSFIKSETTSPSNVVISEQSQDITSETVSEIESQIASGAGAETESETETQTENQTQTVDETVSAIPAESKDEFIASCQKIPYKDLLRNPDDYIGQRIVITAKVQQVVQGGWLDNNEYYRVQTDNDGYDWYMDDEYFMYDYRVDDNTKILQDDILKIYAEFSGVETITRALTGTKDEVPSIKAYYIDLIGE